MRVASGSQDDFDDEVDIGNVHLIVAVDVTIFIRLIIQDGSYDVIDVSNIDLAVTIYITQSGIVNEFVQRDIVDVDA